MLLWYQSASYYLWWGSEGAPRTKMRWLKRAPKRVGNDSLNNGVTWPDGDPQSLRDSV